MERDVFSLVEDKWEALTPEKQKEALAKAYIRCEDLNSIDWYTKKIALEAIGMEIK